MPGSRFNRVAYTIEPLPRAEALQISLKHAIVAENYDCAECAFSS